VVIELSAYLHRTAQRAGHTGLSLIALLGFVAGLAIMYATALLVRF
jgi:hypothetical protein